jgi:signal peptidase I
MLNSKGSIGNTILVVMAIIVMVIFGFGVFFVIMYAFIARPFQVNGQAMNPTYTNGAYVLAQIGTEISRNNVVIYKSPKNPQIDLIKRVIAVPGDKIKLESGYIFINGQKLDESSYVMEEARTFPGVFLRDGEELTVPEKSYFVMGDNRPMSSDSREWGYVLQGDIVGKVNFCYWSCGATK